LIGQNKGYNLPYFPSITQNLNLEGKKFSTSRGITVDAIDVGKHFGVDPVRFYISSILPESKDANWKWEDFKDTVNSELAGNFGNFVHRTLTFYKNKLEGKISPDNAKLESTVEEEIIYIYEMVNEDLQVTSFVSALNRILKLSKFGNQYFDQQKPWASLKENKDECEKTIYNCLQLVYSLTMLFKPFIPQAMERLDAMLGINELHAEIGVDKYNFDILDINKLNIAETLEPLFKKIEDEDVEAFVGK
jgi:methionyl-tRNA synthetase